MSRDGKKLGGRRIVVTGAASGMGEGIARLFASEGANLTLFDIDAEKLASLANELRAESAVCDVSSESEVNTAVDAAARSMDGIDGLVNVAGILVRKQVRETGYDDFQRAVGVNLAGPFLMCRAALPHLEAAEAATIVNIASLAGLRSQPGMAVYSATKAGLVAFSEAFSGELGPTVRINTICPGVIRTPMIDFMFEAQESDGNVENLNRAARPGTPEDVARACLFLTSPDSEFTSAATLAVTGGHFR